MGISEIPIPRDLRSQGLNLEQKAPLVSALILVVPQGDAQGSAVIAQKFKSACAVLNRNDYQPSREGLIANMQTLDRGRDNI